MASAELNSQPQPLFWTHLASWFRSIPRAALLSMVGPSLLCVLGYIGWRYYGAPNLDVAYYGLKQENIHLFPSQPVWLRKTNVLDTVFKDAALANLSLLDGQTPANLARVFDAHWSIKKTHRVEKMAGGQVRINVEYRTPVALVHVLTTDQSGSIRDGYVAVDSDAVLLDMEDFNKEDVFNYVLIYPEEKSSQTAVLPKLGKPFDDGGVKEAAKLCERLLPFREAIKITRVMVYAPIGEPKRFLEIVTDSGPRIEWGSAPGLEGLHEPTVEAKLTRLMTIARDSKLWSQKHISVTERTMDPIKK